MHMRYRLLINILSGLFIVATVSCIKDENQFYGSLGTNVVSFSVKGTDAVHTRSINENAARTSAFLGMVGKDSLFLTVEESDMETAARTKDGSADSPAVPSSFSIAGFKDNSTEAYVNLVVGSTDNWSTYSPMLYWPQYYSKIHFFASTPNAGNALFTPQYSITDGTFSAVFDYTSPAEEERNTDLIYAISPNQAEGENNGTKVKLEFLHLLSAVKFNIPATIGDATITNAKVELTGITAKGNCTVEYNASGNTATWLPYDNSKATYTHIPANEKNTMLIPQTLQDDAEYTITFDVGNAKHSFTGKITDLTAEWCCNRKYTYTISKKEEVKANVEARNTTTYLNDVKILNTGFRTAYIRATVVGYWYSITEIDGTEIEEIASSWEIDDTGTGTVEYPSGWENNWKKGEDGFWYHLQPVIPGDYTSTLFSSYELIKTTGPVSGSKLKIHIVTQAIEEAKAAEHWPYPTAGTGNAQQ